MAHVEVRDYVVWLKHVHDDPEIVGRLLSLPGGQTVELIVDGFRGPWRRMADRPDGSKTPGLQPIAATKGFWSRIYKTRRGGLVPFELAARRDEIAAAAGITPEREAALQAFLALADRGWRSEGPYGPREDLYDR